MLLVEVPVLLLTLRWYRRHAWIGPVALAGALAFFSYYFVSMTFATGQNRLFPVYAAASVAGSALVAVASGMNVPRLADVPTGPPRACGVDRLSVGGGGGTDPGLAAGPRLHHLDG